MSDQDWRAAWEAGPLAPADVAEGAAWMRSRPDSVKALMKRFPPASLVRAAAAPDEVGIVTSYHEPHEDKSCPWCEGAAPEGLVGVRAEPADTTFVHHRPEALEVVGFYKGLTREEVARLLLD